MLSGFQFPIYIAPEISGQPIQDQSLGNTAVSTYLVEQMIFYAYSTDIYAFKEAKKGCQKNSNWSNSDRHLYDFVHGVILTPELIIFSTFQQGLALNELY
jgi:hypothetical protein